MLLGPFGELDLDGVIAILDAKKIKFEIVVSDEGLKALQDNRKGGRYSTTGAKTIHFEIADDDFEKIASQMEKYGIAASDSDGSWELGGSDDDYNR